MVLADRHRGGYLPQVGPLRFSVSRAWSWNSAILIISTNYKTGSNEGTCKLKGDYLLSFHKIIYLFVSGFSGSLLLHVGFLYWQRVEATLGCCVWISHCESFSCCGAQALGVRALVFVACGLSSCNSWALEFGLSSCVEGAYLPGGMWNLSIAGIEPMFPALAGEFLAIGQPGKSKRWLSSASGMQKLRK